MRHQKLQMVIPRKPLFPVLSVHIVQHLSELCNAERISVAPFVPLAETPVLEECQATCLARGSKKEYTREELVSRHRD